MNNQPDNQAQTISDDQELAKVLAGGAPTGDGSLSFEETGSAPASVPVAIHSTPRPSVAAPQPPMPAASGATSVPVATPSTPALAPNPAGAPALGDIKQAVLLELRPLVDKLDVSAEERFDTYLLLLRSTDDKALISPAYEAAKAIADETRRAQALLDIIKEIDYLTESK